MHRATSTFYKKVIAAHTTACLLLGTVVQEPVGGDSPPIFLWRHRVRARDDRLQLTADSGARQGRLLTQRHCVATVAVDPRDRSEEDEAQNTYSIYRAARTGTEQVRGTCLWDG